METMQDAECAGVSFSGQMHGMIALMPTIGQYGLNLMERPENTEAVRRDNRVGGWTEISA